MNEARLDKWFIRNYNWIFIARFNVVVIAIAGFQFLPIFQVMLAFVLFTSLFFFQLYFQIRYRMIKSALLAFLRLF